MRIKVLIILIIIGLKVNSQLDKRFITFFYKPKVSFFSTDNDDFKSNRHPLIKNDIGINLYLLKKEKFKFVIGLIYANKGWEDEYYDLTVKRNYSYIDIPLVFDYILLKNKKLSIHIPVGLVPEILIDYDKKTKINDKKYDIDSKYIGKWDNTCIYLGLSLNYILNEKICVIIEPNLNYQIGMFEHRRFYDIGIKLGIGYGF